MTKKIIFLLSFVFHAFITQHCIAMEEQSSSEEPLTFVPINNGLLTTITAKITESHHFNNPYQNEKSHKTTTTDTLANLMRKDHCNSNTGHIHTDEGYYKPCTSYKLFRPIIMQQANYRFVTSYGTYKFKNHGEFDRQQHKEAKEAIRQNKAVYFIEGHGVIVYNLDQQPNPEIWTQNEIEHFWKILKNY